MSRFFPADTAVRSYWTNEALYFLFVSRYETMYLKPNPVTDRDTVGLWDYDVVEVFIGSDPNDRTHYLEFEVSPQSEWVDLEINRTRREQKTTAEWNSGMTAKSKIDRDKKVWTAEMRIPWRAILESPVTVGTEFTLNLYRIEGGPKDRKYLTWRAVNAQSFHTPSAFGKLRLAPKR